MTAENITIQFRDLSVASPLESAAAQLSANQSIKFNTTIVANDLYGGLAQSHLKWGSTAGWDSVNKQLGWVGKMQSTNPYFHLKYDDATDAWSLPSPPVGAGSGHGYDHTAAGDGKIFYRHYFSPNIYAYDGSSWSLYATSPDTGTIAASISYWPGRGLFWINNGTIRYYNGSSWVSTGQSNPQTSYHGVSEYNATQNAIYFGGDNSGSTAMYRLNANDTIDTMSSCPISYGSSESMGVFCTSPNSGHLIVRDKDFPNNWYRYDTAANSWSSLSQSSGDGSAPQTGTPNMGTPSDRSMIACSIPDYNVQMWIDAKGTSTTPEVWLYKVA